jgi:ankyrin repeat protein
MEAAELLLANGANVNAKANNGDTPLGLAVFNGGFKNMAELLRQHGAR